MFVTNTTSRGVHAPSVQNVRRARKLTEMHGKELRDLRRKSGLKQSELGNEFDIDELTIASWETISAPLSSIYSLLFERFFRDTERINQIVSKRDDRRFGSVSERRRHTFQNRKDG